MVMNLAYSARASKTKGDAYRLGNRTNSGVIIELDKNNLKILSDFLSGHCQ